MFDVAWSELALIGAVALVVIGPKDLPKVMRTLGQWTRRARLLAGEFQRNFDEMVRQAELDEVRKEVESAKPAVVKFGQMVQDAVADAGRPPVAPGPAGTAVASGPVVAAPVEPAPRPDPEAAEPVAAPAALIEGVVPVAPGAEPVAVPREGAPR